MLFHTNEKISPYTNEQVNLCFCVSGSSRKPRFAGAERRKGTWWVFYTTRTITSLTDLETPLLAQTALSKCLIKELKLFISSLRKIKITCTHFHRFTFFQTILPLGILCMFFYRCYSNKDFLSAGGGGGDGVSATSCKDLRARGTMRNGIYKIKPSDSTSAFYVSDWLTDWMEELTLIQHIFKSDPFTHFK